MEIKIIQSLVSRTRNEINSLHEEALAAKAHRNLLYEKAGKVVGCREHDWEQRAYLQSLGDNSHCAYEKATKTIAKLALLQRALKTEMYSTLLDEAFLKTLTIYDGEYVGYGVENV